MLQLHFALPSLRSTSRTTACSPESSRVRAGRLDVIDTATEFLVEDPWCFGSGYVKADLMHALANADLPVQITAALRRVVSRHVQDPQPRLLRYASQLAANLWDDELEGEILRLEAVGRQGETGGRTRDCRSATTPSVPRRRNLTSEGALRSSPPSGGQRQEPLPRVSAIMGWPGPRFAAGGGRTSTALLSGVPSSRPGVMDGVLPDHPFDKDRTQPTDLYVPNGPERHLFGDGERSPSPPPHSEGTPEANLTAASPGALTSPAVRN